MDLETHQTRAARSSARVNGADGEPPRSIRQRPEHRWILGMRVDVTSYVDAVRRVAAWTRDGETRYVCVATAHMAIEAHDSPEFRRVVNQADLVTPDGMPLVWGLRLLGARGATRVYGPDLMLHILETAAAERLPIGLYGGRPSVVARLAGEIARRYPGLTVAFCESPPYRQVTPDEDRTCVERIEQSGARVLFVGLGCPKQERWMGAHAGRVRTVMIGVGAAFDFLAGARSQAPGWMQRAGLEWFYRLCSEPRRLWRRYLVHGPRFVVLLAVQLLGTRLRRTNARTR